MPSNSSLRTGAKGLALIKSFEKCRLQAYMPTPKDRPTIGWGSTGPDIKMGMTWTQAQADQRFAADLNKFERGVLLVIGATPTTQNQFDAMVSLAYNIGEDGFAKSSVARYHRAGDKKRAAASFALWNKQAGKVLGGLVRRRAEEAKLYLS